MEDWENFSRWRGDGGSILVRESKGKKVKCTVAGVLAVCGRGLGGEGWEGEVGPCGARRA